MNIHLTVITDGRQDCLERTLESAEASLDGPIRTRQIVDDSADPAYGAWLHAAYGDHYRIHSTGRRSGFGGAIRVAWSLIPPSADLLFHLEDDFVFLERVDLVAMAATLAAHPGLKQLVLKRQPSNDPEVEAGGIVEMWPDEYTERHDDQLETTWTEHRLFFSTNPHLMPVATSAAGWPTGDRSEHAFSQQLFEDPSARAAFWGPKYAPPKVMHIGQQRAGTGY